MMIKMLMSQHFCPNGTTLHEIWVDHGISKCFMDTVASAVIGGYFLVACFVQLLVYKKYATEVNDHHLPSSWLYRLQIFFSVFCPILASSRLALQATLLDDKTVYGYMLLDCSTTVVTYLLSIWVIYQERHFLLPSVPTRGHGLVLLLFWTLNFIRDNLSFVNFEQKNWWFHIKDTNDVIEMTLFIAKYVSDLFLFIMGLKAPGIMQNVDYFSLTDSMHRLPTSMASDENVSTWRNFWKKVRVLAPFLWPKKDVFLQCRVMICFACLAGGRVINLYVPIYSKLIIDSMTIPPILFRWELVLIYVAFKFLQGGGTGGMGLLNNLRNFLWIRIQQFTTREIEVELFRHLHSLSLRWHLSRRTGEVLRVMDRGTDSINNLLNYILFSIAPTIIDIVVACVFFVMAFNMWFGLIVFTTMLLYIVMTILVTEWRTKYQRRMNLADNATRARSMDSLINFETVKYYGAEAYEVQAFRDAVLNFQNEEWKSIVTLNILNTVQNVIICSGLLAGSLLCVHMVVDHNTLTVGDYVLFAGYIIQLYTPLNWFGTYYRAIQKNFVDMENMFDLMKEEQEVIDAPGAGPLHVRQGVVEFNNVSFGYQPERTVLKNISFSVHPGRTLALVGPSGAGKSTIIRLLFRFYDVQTGCVTVDGQNVKTVTQESLRRAIGVVPQDTVLFNNTIQYNIKYGRLSATDAEVIEAARAADIHDRILTFPEAYDTQVGERGLRLSGGEKQRVAIARTILKAPVVVLLDEATSALDTHTERNIQDALEGVCNERTTIIVAHRLSTVIHADEILVLKEGEIVERGKHEFLIGQDGVYAQMWFDQLKNPKGTPPEGVSVESSSETPG